MDPLWDYNSQALAIYYLAYSIAVLSLALNFFTTIILDAYTVVGDEEWKPWWEMNQSFHEGLAAWVFPGVEEEMLREEAEAQESMKKLREILAHIPKHAIQKKEMTQRAEHKLHVVRKAPVRRA